MTSKQTTLKSAVQKAQEEIREALELLKQKQTKAVEETRELLKKQEAGALDSEELESGLEEILEKLKAMDIHEI
jgi:hypothetical protein